jgi:hypothetical protein
MKFQYEYDFGDRWEHEVIVENDTVNINTKYPIYCVEGERACPPEDCGGVDGYAELLRILANPDDPEYGEKSDWLRFVHSSNFDSERFDPDSCNRGLRVRKPESLNSTSAEQEALRKKKKLERKRKDAAKKRNRK